MATTKTPKISKKALQLIDTKQSDNMTAVRERDKNLTMLDIFGGDEQKTAVAFYVSDLIAKGNNNKEIIDAVKAQFGLNWTLQRLGIVKQMIHKIWRADMVHALDEHKAKELAMIDVQIKEAWAAFEKSKHPKRKKQRTEKSIGCDAAGTNYDLTESEENEEELAGDPKYLTIISDLGKERRKLLGLYEPEKTDVGGGGMNIQFNVVGDSATAKSADLLSMFMNMGAGMIQQQTAARKVEEASAEVVEAEPVARAKDTDDVVEDLMAQFLA